MEAAVDDKDKAQLIWEEQNKILENETCKRCVFCKGCKLYFWLELGEILFNKVNTKKQNGVYIPVRNIPDNILRNLTPSKKITDIYYNKYCRKYSKLEDGFIVLKGMSSSTPSLMNSIYDTNQYSGGGFYLRYNGIGIAIDPGYHFIDNLHHYGLSVLDIDAVVITHEHIDHNNDMRLLDDLHHAVYNLAGPKKKIYWYLDKVSYEIARIYQKNNTGFQEEANIIYCLSDHGEDKSKAEKEICICDNVEVRLKIFKTKHIENKKIKNLKKYNEHTFGCCFLLENDKDTKCLVYTSDTSYFPELIENINIYPDVLIANISGIYEDDIMLIKKKERHLGYYGCYHLLIDIKERFNKFPEMVFISEFWNGEHDIRFDVTSFLEKEIKREDEKHSVRIIPAEVGMVLRITDSALRCTQCGKFTKEFKLHKPNSYNEKIKVLCKSCIY